jgi:hypothetical protein
MEAKLYKVLEHYHLYYGDKAIATTIVGNPMLLPNLSLKNCQAIERGYDLDELAEKELPYKVTRTDFATEECRKIWIDGFQKALEILGDKKFSEDDMKEAMLNALEMTAYQIEQFRKDNKYHIATDIIQSLQQTEWDVEVQTNEKTQTIGDLLVFGKPDLILDADGCIILKRIK